jgi:hypothetical protein
MCEPLSGLRYEDLILPARCGFRGADRVCAPHAQHEDLDLLLALRAKAQHGQLEQPPQRPVEKRQNHALTTTRQDTDPSRSHGEPQTATRQTP